MLEERWLKHDYLPPRDSGKKAETQNFVLYKPTFSLTVTLKIFKA